MKRTAPAFLAAALLLAAAAPVQAASPVVASKGPLPDLRALQAAAPERDGGEKRRAAKRRGEAQRLAALSWASQTGLAHRGREIAALLEKRSKALSAVFDFRALLLDRGGFLVMPPVLAETRDAVRITDGMAASARRVLRIAAGERIVGAPPVWRDWLERGWEAAGGRRRRCCSRATKTSAGAGTAGWRKAGSTVSGLRTTFTPRTWSGWLRRSRAWCAGTGFARRRW